MLDEFISISHVQPYWQIFEEDRRHSDLPQDNGRLTGPLIKFYA